MSGFLRVSVRLFVASASVATVLASSPVFAFHEGGSGFCEGCHDLHGGGNSTRAMLLGSDASSTCLRCHGNPSQLQAVLSDKGDRYTPGGDFYWLKQTFEWSGPEGSGVSKGERHGHNVIAGEFGLVADGALAHAPGGEYLSSALSCVSCHDPHGRIAARAPVSTSGSYGATAPAQTVTGTFRMLGGEGYADKFGKPFVNAAPVARASNDWKETDRNHTAYGSGMSEWCANCHRAMLSGVGGKKHPSGKEAKLGKSVTANYNYYLRSGSLAGSKDTAYLALVPFETGATDAASLNPASTQGPEVGDANLMCLSCHRAHASAFTSAGRWDFKSTFLADSHPGPKAAGGNNRHAYYGRDMVAQFGAYQRSLCNKCHAQD